MVVNEQATLSKSSWQTVAGNCGAGVMGLNITGKRLKYWQASVTIKLPREGYRH